MINKQSGKVVCLGNGESRLGVDLDGLKQHATVWGCNALYRDWTPDRLVCVDLAMSHEIYRSGYCFNNVVYFRDWSRLPEEAYDLVVRPSHISKEDIIDLETYIHESPRVENCNEFVMSGQDLDMLRELREQVLTEARISGRDINPHNVDIVLDEMRAGLWITWVAAEDKVIKTESLPGDTDYGFDSGSLSSLLASVHDEPDEVYLLGMDLYSTTTTVNNVYKGTGCYMHEKGDAISPVHWIGFHKLIFDQFPHIQYYKVNPGEQQPYDRVNRVIEEWNDTPNLEYISQKEMWKRFL